MPHVIAVDPAQHAALAFAAAWHHTRLRADWQARRAAAYELPTSTERRQALTKLHAERSQRRAEGTWWDSQAAIMTAHLRTDLAARGWLDRSWRPVPHHADRLPGRRTGVPAHRAGPRWTGRLVLDLPDHLDRPLVRGAYWTSRPATRRLQAWLDHHPYPHDPQEQAELDELRAGITTTGDVLRTVLHTATQAWFPTVGVLSI